MSPVIRGASERDRGALRRLLGAQMAEHAIDVPAGRMGEAIDAVLGDPSLGMLLVAELDGEPVGVAYLSFIWSIEHGGKSGWLDELYVDPPARAHGVGSRLLDAALEAARAAGCVAVDLEVEEDHARVESLYRRAGFRARTRRRWVLELRRS